MASKIPTAYRKSSELIATYDYTDLDEGVGYVTYYAFNQATSGGKTYGLSKERVYSRDIELSGASNASPGYFLSGSFDVTFNLNKIIKGPARINIPINRSGGGSPSIWIRAEFIHIDTSDNETSMATEFSDNITSGMTPTILNMEVDIPITKFKPSEKLRLDLKYYGNSNPATTEVLFHDPQNRDGYKGVVGTDIATTTTSVQIPFLLQT